MAFGNQVVRRFSEYKDFPSAYSGRNRDAAENPFPGPCGLSHDQFFTIGSGFEKRNVKCVATRRQPGEKRPPPFARPLPPMRMRFSMEFFPCQTAAEFYSLA